MVILGEILDYNGTQINLNNKMGINSMLAKIISKKWRNFTESLAILLNASIAVLDSEGKLITSFSEFSILFKFENCPGLKRKYREFFQLIAAENGNKKELFFLTDPLGLLLAVIPSNGIFILIGGFYQEEIPDVKDILKARLKKYGIEEKDGLADFLPLPELLIKEQARHVACLYQILMSFSLERDNQELENKMVFVVEEISKFFLCLLERGSLPVTRSLNMIASFLVALLDVEGAWVYAYVVLGKTVKVYRGASWDSEFPEIETEWRDSPAFMYGDSAPVKLDQVQENSDSKYYLETTFSNNRNVKTFLGIVYPGNRQTKTPLANLCNQVAIIMEMAVFNQVLQRRQGDLINSIKHGVLVINISGEIMLINLEAVSVLKRIGIHLSQGMSILDTTLPNTVIKAARAAALLSQSFLDQKETIKNNGNALHIRWNATPLIDRGTTIGSIIIFEDITESVNLFRQVQDSERLAVAGEVAAGLAHEIRNPLSVASGGLQLMEMIDDKEKRLELLKMVQGELKRMNMVLTDFLKTARPDRSEVSEKIVVQDFLRELDLLLKGDAHLHDILLQVMLPPAECPPLIVKKNSLKQVCLNIAKNSFEAIDKGGILVISSTWDENNITLIFQDNGPGIPEENLGLLFRPFFSTKMTGTGLGLSVSNAIIKSMGGLIKVESEVGRGTTVRVILPRSQSNTLQQ